MISKQPNIYRDRNFKYRNHRSYFWICDVPLNFMRRKSACSNFKPNNYCPFDLTPGGEGCGGAPGEDVRVRLPEGGEQLAAGRAPSMSASAKTVAGGARLRKIGQMIFYTSEEVVLKF